MYSDTAASIIAVQNAYATCIDSRDWAGLRRCFTEDAEITYGVPARNGGIDGFLEWAPPFHEALGPTLHQTGTHCVTIDGPTAAGSAYLHAVLVDPDGRGAREIFGRYEDTFVERDGRWLIRSRIFRPVWRRYGPTGDAPKTHAQ